VHPPIIINSKVAGKFFTGKLRSPNFQSKKGNNLHVVIPSILAISKD